MCSEEGARRHAAGRRLPLDPGIPPDSRRGLGRLAEKPILAHRGPLRAAPSGTSIAASIATGDSGYGTTFRAADRPFQLFLAFGDKTTDERLAQVEAIIDSLHFDTLPPPPADPYAGWPLLSDNSGDSLRPPPGWPGAAFEYRPGKTSRPRSLFFTSNLPLWGLPKKLVARTTESGSEDGLFPRVALANEFPSDGVLLFVDEEAKGGPSPDFPAIESEWPAAESFSEAEIATSVAPEITWLRSSGSFSGYRFSVWIGRGPEVSEQDFQLALQSAASLAVSGCWRDRYDDCAED